jgi:hypothetical protein
MSVALHGNLRDFGIAEVFQLIGQQRKTGRLVVGEGDDSIVLAFDEGRVVRGGPASEGSDSATLGRQLVRSGLLTREQFAELQNESERSARPLSDLFLATGLFELQTLEDVQHLLTRETVFDVIRRQQGDFHFIAEAVVHQTKPENLLGAEQILMDGLRMLDEWQTFTEIVPSEESVFRRIGDLESARALTKGDSDSRLGHAERVLQLVDGRLSVRRVIDLSRLGTFDATRALAELRQAGVIDLCSSKKPAPRTSFRISSGRRLLPTLRVAMASLVPFLALGFMVYSALPANRSLAGTAGSIIPERHGPQMGLRFETELIRRMVEERMFETGSYPVALGEIATKITDESPSLTPSRLGAYYYVVRDGDALLLAAER